MSKSLFFDMSNSPCVCCLTTLSVSCWLIYKIKIFGKHKKTLFVFCPPLSLHHNKFMLGALMMRWA